MAETGMESEHMRIGDGLVVSSTYWNMLLNSDEGSFDEDALRLLGERIARLMREARG